MQDADLSSVDMQCRTHRKATGRGGRGRSAEWMEACVLAKKPSRPSEGSRLGWKLWIPRGPGRGCWQHRLSPHQPWGLGGA